MCGTIRPFRVLKPTTRAHSLQPHHIFLYYVMCGRTYKAIRHIRCDSVSVILCITEFSSSFHTGVRRVCWEAPIAHTTPTDKSTQPLFSKGFKLSQTPPPLLPPQFMYRFLHLPKTKPHMLLLSSTHRLVWNSSHFSHQQHWMWPRQYRQHCTDMWADLTGWYNQKHFDIFNVDDVF